MAKKCMYLARQKTPGGRGGAGRQSSKKRSSMEIRWKFDGNGNRNVNRHRRAERVLCLPQRAIKAFPQGLKASRHQPESLHCPTDSVPLSIIELYERATPQRVV